VSFTSHIAGAIHSPERGIIAALRSGDVRRAVELLLEAYQDELYLYCVRLVGGKEAIAVYHRALSAAIDDLPARDASLSLRAWLFRIARRTIVHHHRLDQRQYPGALDPDYVPVSGPQALTGVAATSETPAQLAMSQLAEPVREVLQLSMWHGLTLAEVARVTECGVERVRELAAEGLSQAGFYPPTTGEAPC